MFEAVAVPDDDGKQDPVVHDGAPPDGLDSNEHADDKVQIQQPSGEPAPEAPEQ